MSDTGYLKEFYNLVKKSKFSVEEERVAKVRERQRRERKEKLYSYSPEKPLSLWKVVILYRNQIKKPHTNYRIAAIFMVAVFIGAPSMARSALVGAVPRRVVVVGWLGGESPLSTRQGEWLVERQGCQLWCGIWSKPKANHWPDEEESHRRR